MSTAPVGAPLVALIALGNPMRGDDALGPAVGERVLGLLRARDPQRTRSALSCRAGGLDALAIVDAWSDAQLAIVVDAARSSDPPGTLSRLCLRGEGSGRSTPGGVPAPAPAPTRATATVIPRETARASSHGLGLAQALALGDALARLPARIVCYTIEAERFAHGAPLTADVAAVIETAAARIADEILCAWHHRAPPSEPSTPRNTGTP